MKFKFRLNEGFDDSPIEESVLNEDKLYKAVSGNKKFYFFAGDKDSKFTSMKTCDELHKYMNDTLGKNSHEKLNADLMQQLDLLGSSNIDIFPIDHLRHLVTSHGAYANRLLNTTYRASRKDSHTNVENDLSNVEKKLFGDLIVHHLDFTELNKDRTNLIGLDGDALHKLAHEMPLVKKSGTSYVWTKRYNSVVLDPSTNKFVMRPCRVTMEIK